MAEANRLEEIQDAAIALLEGDYATSELLLVPGVEASPILHRQEATDAVPAVCYRQAGDRHLLVEYGPPVLDLDLRFRVHALMTWLQAQAIEGITDLTPGIR
ncbi:MAG: carboxyltransferase domain-containing protein, partial [Ignavibacteriaceae bacterium]